jgi:vitamin B12 transporter
LKNIALFIIINLLIINELRAQDSLLLNPVLIVDNRLSRYAGGQIQVELDSLTLTSGKNLAAVLPAYTTATMKSYGTGLSSISLRGTGANHTALVWNGLNIQASTHGIVDFSMLPLSMANKISIRYGGGSALFGSGAIGGTVFVDNAPPAQNGLQIIENQSIESYQTYSMGVSAAYRKGAFATNIGVNAVNAANDFVFKNIAEVGQPLQKQVNAAAHQTNIFNHNELKINDKQILKTHLWFQSADRQIPPVMSARNDEARQIDRATRIAAEWNYIDNQSVTKIRIGHFDEYLKYQSDLVAHSEFKPKTTIGEAEQQFVLKNNQNIRLGIHYTLNQATTVNYARPVTRQKWAALASYQVEYIKNNTFTINLRQEKVDNALIPLTFSMGSKNIFKNHWAIRGQFSRNYNLPTFNDLYWTTGGNLNLKAESGYSGEIGIDFYKKYTDIVIDCSTTIYGNQTLDKIQWIPVKGGLWQPFNLEKTRATGIENSVSFKKIFPYGYGQLAGHYAYGTAIQMGGAFNLKQLMYIPKHQAGWNGHFSYKTFFVTYHQSISGKRYTTSDNLDVLPIFTVANLGFGKHFKGKIGGMETRFEVNNLFNTNYQSVAYYAMPRRTYRLAIAFKY